MNEAVTPDDALSQDRLYCIQTGSDRTIIKFGTHKSSSSPYVYRSCFFNVILYLDNVDT
jgi:hypothetical protein